MASCSFALPAACTLSFISFQEFSFEFEIDEKMGSFIQIQENQLQESFLENKEKRVRRTTKKHFIWDYGKGLKSS